jgi:nitrogen-specific signal transduction histidine kinase
MKTFNYTLSDLDIQKVIDIEYFNNYPNLLVQIFCGASKEALEHISKSIATLLPHSICIGTTTDGEIENRNIHTKHIIISITVFESTTIKSAYAHEVQSFANGEKLAKELIGDDTKLLIAFTDGTTTNGEEFLKGIQSVDSKVIVAGGMAGDNGNFVQTYISCGDLVLDQGAVGVSLNSQKLSVYNDYSFNWSPIGIGHRIDKVEGNRVYLIDGMKPVAFYSKYLGEDVADLLPATGIEFPLIIERNSIQIARAVISKHSDGSLSFAGNLQEGDIVRLGFGNAQMIMKNSSLVLQKFTDIKIESFFIYSCMARRRYMPDIIQVEIEPFAKVAPVAGFFTYGEFFHTNSTGKNELLNQTLTVVALSESNQKQQSIPATKHSNIPKEYTEYATTIQALTNLIEQSTADLEDQAKKLEFEKQFSQQLLAKQKLFMRYAIHETITPLSVIMNNIDLFEMEFGDNTYLSNIAASMKNIFTIYDDLSYFVKKDHLIYQNHKIDLVAFIQSRINFFKQVATQTNLQFDFCPTLDSLFVDFNETKLQRIVDNNITNALKYTLEGEIISIGIVQKRDMIVLFIESRSTHIQYPKKVFEPYYREEYSKDGFGLGLNLVKQICDESNIGIRLRSTKQKTSFSYFFKASL